MEIEINETELREFLVEAKKNTYASGNKAVKLNDGFEEFIFEDNNFSYRDRYHAKDPRPFGGEEVVWHRGKAIWMMNYYGYLLDQKIDNKKLYLFLRKSMSQIGKNRPFRGPSRFKEDNFEYIDESQGDITNFKGTEKIFCEGKEVYRLEYHGGLL